MSQDPHEPVAQGGNASGDGPGRAAVDEPVEAVEAQGDAGSQLAPDDRPARPLGRRAQAAVKKAEKEAAKKAEEVRELKNREVPADAYVVDLPTFQGPLDLLLHLIQKHELDILDIPVSFVTEKYLAYLDVMRTLSIDVASEYLVMAATLLHIKSKMLLPQLPGGQDDVGEEEEEDPRGELVRRLLDYQKYKAASEELHDRDLLGHKVFPRGSGEIAPPGPAPFAQFGVFNLFDALEKVLARTKTKMEHNVVFDRISITDRIVELTQKMKARRQMLFEELFEPDRTTFEVVITFLAVLEMCKLKLMRVYQADVLASIHVELMIVDDIAEGDELEFAQSGGQSLASGPLPPAMPEEPTAELDAAVEAAVEAEPELPPPPDAPDMEAPPPPPDAPDMEAPPPPPDAPDMEAPPPAPDAPDTEAPPPPPDAPDMEAPPPAPDAPDTEAPPPDAPDMEAPPPPPDAPDMEAPPPPPAAVAVEDTTREADALLAAPEAPVLDAEAAFEAEFAALLAEEEAERQAARAAAGQAPADETMPPGDMPAPTVDD